MGEAFIYLSLGGGIPPNPPLPAKLEKRLIVFTKLNNYIDLVSYSNNSIIYYIIK